MYPYPPHAYEPWHGDLPDDPRKAMHAAREASVIESEKRYQAQKSD